MPNINRIRVNNVKYNFGTQYYDDFTMKMYGKNTLYDLANGGGKSVLMLLLMQNLIPNCTLDDKQPIEKLFRTGNKNTVIHSLIEWNLDDCDIKEGYRYMTTGFCAKKANETSEDESGVASVEYFNYCIFYRNYNKNDIINLPLVKDRERISYHALRAYLKDLEHHSMDLIVKVFDRKGEYQRFISSYGLHESQWEIIRGINKTEGHVRTYFETNYKTTRKVVEDLLIEEIIEKAFMVKTERDENTGDAMADTLVDIKDRLALLAKKKKDISDYDHQKELIELLADRIKSFSELYKDMEGVSDKLAGIYLAGKDYALKSEEKEAFLYKEKQEKTDLKNQQIEKLECLKISKDKRILEDLRADIDLLIKNKEELENKKIELEHRCNLEECKSDYAEYLDEKARYMQCEAELNELSNFSDGNFSDINTYVFNLKKLIDNKIYDMGREIEKLTNDLEGLNEKRDYYKKTLNELFVQLAVSDHDREKKEGELEKLRVRLSEEMMKLSEVSFEDTDIRLKNNQEERDLIKIKTDELKETLGNTETALADYRSEAVITERLLDEKRKKKGELETLCEKYSETAERLEKLKNIYGGNTPDEISRIIEERLTKTAGELNDAKKELAECEKNIERLKSGRLLKVSKAAEKVIDYITTRHGIYAMYGMDYISVLKKEEKEALLKENPLLPYGVLVKDFSEIKDDASLKALNTGSSTVNIYDMDNLGERALIYGNNIISVSASKAFFTDSDTADTLIKAEDEKLNEIKERIIVIKETADALKDDLKFVPSEETSAYLNSPDELKALIEDISFDEENLTSLKEKILKSESEKEKLLNEIRQSEEKAEILKKDEKVLLLMKDISDEISEAEKSIDKLKTSVKELNERKTVLEKEESEVLLNIHSLNEALNDRKIKSEELIKEWEKYAPYYKEGEYQLLNISLEELKAKINVYAEGAEKDLKKIQDKRALMDAISKGMKRILNNISRRNISVSHLEELSKKGEIYRSEEKLIDEYRENIKRLQYEIAGAEKKLSEKNREADRLEGSIAYAVKNVESAYGKYTEENAPLSEIEIMLRDGAELLKKLKSEAEECEERCRAYYKEQGFMTDLYKDVKRIITINNIDLSNASPSPEDKDNLREVFEDTLIRFDRSKKQLDRAKREIEKFKQTVSNTLYESGAAELSTTIRENAEVPENYGEAKKLLDSLKEIIDYITLERDGIEKGLYDMELLKSNFEEQCLQRCLDVKTELDKLEKLSRIILDGESVKMIDLHVPYVKQEFMKQRMSDYIDDIVKQADSFKDDKDRRRYIRNALSLKKLFGVIVTDMNMIKLNLYKRERISKNSRYLKYEEAVGSTGQSQGIYIQFLISVINYISGMYNAGGNGMKTGTIFIDNPFGAAKDIYIWEPIFALLKANNIQLIVPARGATPAITGRFDVNYVLGQKMEGDKQLTVVVDYTSSIDQEELEYNELTYEQETFDFV